MPFKFVLLFNETKEFINMINDEIIAIKDSILNAVGETCEKIILFGSYAYGEPRKNSDYDFFVVLRDDTEKPILVLQNIYRRLAENPNYKAVDVLANYKSRFELRSKLPTIEKTIAKKGIVLYDHT
jgi:predicted nucleotidyltransferase